MEKRDVGYGERRQEEPRRCMDTGYGGKGQQERENVCQGQQVGIDGGQRQQVTAKGCQGQQVRGEEGQGQQGPRDARGNK